nr:MAG TPA: Sigma-54 interaction domain [Caudoviricetes sp.]
MTKNIFDTTVEVLTNDTNALTKKYHDSLNNGKIREAIDTLRLLKDTLSLIKEYDWHLEYSDINGEISVWEQNHSGETRKKRKWFTNGYCGEIWYRTFSYYIQNNKNYLADKTLSRAMRGSGKSESLSKLCNMYNGIVVYNMASGFREIRNRDDELGYANSFVKYEEFINNIDKYKNRIVFLDECHGLDCDEIDKIKENNLVIGFES